MSRHFAGHVSLLTVLTVSASCATLPAPEAFAAEPPAERDRGPLSLPSPSLEDAPEAAGLDAAVTRRDAGDLAGAAAALRAFLAAEPEHAEAPLARVLLGLTLVEQAQYGEAERVLREADRVGPLSDLTAFLEGEVLRGLARPEAALSAYRRVLDTPRSPYNPIAAFRLGDALYEAGRCPEAVAHWSPLVDTFPEYPGLSGVRLRLAECALERDTKDGIRRLADLALRAPPGDARYAARQHLDALERRGHRVPPVPFAEQLQHAISLRQERHWPEALAALDRLEPKATNARDKRTLLEERARTLESLDRYKDALQALEHAEAAGARDTEPQRIRLLRKLGRTAEAVRRTTRRVGGRREQNRLAAELLYQDGDYAEALALYRPLLSGRKDVDSRWRLAWLEYRAGNPSVAERQFGALVPRTDADMAQYWQARAAKKAGRDAAAKRLFVELARRNPLSYYGIQAANRLLDDGEIALYCEITGARHDDLPARHHREAAAGGVAWGGAEGDEAPAATHGRRTRRLRDAIDDYGQALPELRRALARYRIGLDHEARLELRTALSELSRARRGNPKALADLAGSLYVDYRAEKRGLWGGPVKRRLGLSSEALAREVRRLTALKALARDAAPLVRSLLAEVGDPYWGRRQALRELGRGQWEPPSDRTRAAFKRAYPLPFGERVAAETEHRGVPPFLLMGLMRVESGFNDLAVSTAGARGLLQVMPVTGWLIAKEIGDTAFSPSKLLEPGTSIQYGSWYISELLEKFRGQEPLAIIAYNAGPHRVHDWLSHRRTGTAMDEFIEEVPYTQARKYVKSVLRTIGIYRRVYADRADLYVGQALNTRFRDNINW